MNFLWGKLEFSMPNLCSLIFPVLKGVVLSKIINRTKIGLFKGIFPCRFSTIEAFYAKYRKGISMEKNGIFFVESSFPNFAYP